MIQCRNMTRPQTGKGVVDWETFRKLNNKIARQLKKNKRINKKTRKEIN